MLRQPLGYVLVLLCAAGSGCDGGGDGDGDGDVDGDGDADLEIAEPDPPASPAPAVLTPCPDGWREVASTEPDGVATCDPWPDGGPLTCAADEAHFLGEPGCTRIGTACPAGEWPEGLPTDREVLYVRAGAAEGGAGTRDSPFGTIGEAMDASEAGTVIALSKGTFDEPVRLREGRTLWGACVAETVVACSAENESVPTILTTASDVVVRNLQIGGDRRGLRASERSGSVELIDVLVSGARIYGVHVDYGGSLRARGLVVRGTESRPSDGGAGHGLSVQTEATVEVERALFEGNREAGVFVYDPGTTLSMTDVVVRDTLARSSGRFGRGLNVESGAAVEVHRAAFEGNREVGIFAAEEGTTVALADVVIGDARSGDSDGRCGGGLAVGLGATAVVDRAAIERTGGTGVFVAQRGATATLTDVVIRDTHDIEGAETGGRGLSVQDGAHAEVLRAALERNRELGVFVASEGTSVRLTDVAVRDSQGRDGNGEGGEGLSVQEAATVDVERAVLERNRSAGVFVAHGGSVVTLTDVVIRDTRYQESDEEGGRGINVQEGARVELHRAVLERNQELGVFAEGWGTTVILADIVVQDTLSRESDGAGGRGINVQDGAAVEVSRAVLERNRENGAFAAGEGASLTLTDVIVRETRSRETDGTSGRGVTAQEAAAVVVTRALLERNQEIGVIAFDVGTRLTLTDVVVRETLERDCVHSECPGLGAGIGIGAYCGATVEATAFLVTENQLCGVQIAAGSRWDEGTETAVDCLEGGAIDLHDGVVSRSPIGANVQVEGFDIERLMDEVSFEDNVRDLDAELLPAPEPGESLLPE